VVDQLAGDYSGQSVVFLEYNVDDDRYDLRQWRWFAGYGGGGSVFLPLAMVDSGKQTRQSVGTYPAYQSMVNTSLARPAQAEVSADWQRVGNHVRFNATVKNLSGTTLNTAKDARVWGIVYEETHVQLTNRFVRAVGATAITSLADNATATFTVDTADLDGDVNWDKLHFIALVDYRPGGSSGPYDMLQAASADMPVAATPHSLTFLVDPLDSLIGSLPVTITGPAEMTWNAAPGAAWITASPLNGTPAAPAQVGLVKSLLSSGWQSSTIVFASPDGKLNQTIVVNAYLGAVHRVYLPVLRR
jgi:hypothetical protein